MHALMYIPVDRVWLMLVVLAAALLVACSGGAPAAESTVEATRLPSTPVPTETSTTVPLTLVPTIQPPTLPPTLVLTVQPLKLPPTSTVIAAATVRPAAPVPTPTPTSLPPTPTPIPAPTATAVADGAVDITRLPMGDGRVSTWALSGNVWSCRTTFQDRRIHKGPWLNGDGTFDYTKKVVVPGEVKWPSSFDVTMVGSLRTLTGNSLPSHPTGVFPIPRNSEAYSYDPNPNGISSQTLSIEFPAMPTPADQPSCLQMGPIGIMLTGGLFFNALDAAGVDAVAHEVRDSCDGHPQGQGKYHYHNLTPCVDDVEDGHSELMGYAFDGYGIYGLRGENGQLLTNGDLGACHGHTHDVEWDGEMVNLFHYHATWEYPYTVGCYRGSPVNLPR